MIIEIEYLRLFLSLLAIVAFLYASVGHGGASGYLALMAIFSFTTSTMKPIALLLNLFVSGIAFYHYYRTGHFNKKLFIPFAVASIPFAFFGGRLQIDANIYKTSLAILLIFAILKMLNVFGVRSKQVKEIKVWQGVAIGSCIGFISGLIGIGGGIILTPIILLLHWGKMKEAAAVSALFIWVNSAAGLMGQLSIGVEISSQAFILVGVALTGGYLGSYLGSQKFNNTTLRYLLALVLLIASIKLLVV